MTSCLFGVPEAYLFTLIGILQNEDKAYQLAGDLLKENKNAAHGFSLARGYWHQMWQERVPKCKEKLRLSEDKSVAFFLNQYPNLFTDNLSDLPISLQIFRLYREAKSVTTMGKIPRSERSLKIIDQMIQQEAHGEEIKLEEYITKTYNAWSPRCFPCAGCSTLRRVLQSKELANSPNAGQYVTPL